MHSPNYFMCFSNTHWTNSGKQHLHHDSPSLGFDVNSAAVDFKKSTTVQGNLSTSFEKNF